MPRCARIDIANHLYHVMARGIEYRKIFIDKADYEDFLARLAIALEKTSARCLAWCLMPNHFHLLIKRGARPLSEMMRRTMTGYALSFNSRHKRCGHLFQNRYKAVLCEEENYLLELTAYIHLNPIRGGIVDGLEGLKAYPWCGHGALYGTNVNGFVDRGYILSHFGRDENSALARYKQFVAERVGKYGKGEYNGGGLMRSMGGLRNVLVCRKSDEKEMFDDRILGSGRFVESVLREVEDPSPRLVTREEALKEVENVFGVSEKAMKSYSRKPAIAKARALYCYLRRVKGGVNGSQLMRELGISSGAASYLTQRGIEIAKAECLSCILHVRCPSGKPKKRPGG